MLNNIKEIIILYKFSITSFIISIIGIILISNMHVKYQYRTYFEIAFYSLIFTSIIFAVVILYKIMFYIADKNKYIIFSFVLKTFKKSISVLLLLFILNSILTIIDFPTHTYQVFQKLFLIFIIATLTWIIINLIMAIEKIILLKQSERDSLQAKASYTKMHILRQITILFIFIISISTMLMSFDSAREIGIGLFASAGFLGIIAGFAAQKTLSAFVGGLQLAFTQPIKIGDAVFIKNEFGFVEEITLTYVIVKLWDLRRLIIPVNYFLENIFQNWSRTSSELLGTVFLKIDYSVNIGDLRDALKSILNDSQYSDKKVGILDLTEFKGTYIELRILVSAQNSDYLWKLRCEIREKMLVYLLRYYPHCMPKFRITHD